MTDIYEAFERFCIMESQPDVGVKKALEYIRKKYGNEMAVKVMEECGRER